MKLYDYLKEKEEEVNENLFKSTYGSQEGQEAMEIFTSYLRDLGSKIKDINLKDISNSISKKISLMLQGDALSSGRKEESEEKIENLLQNRIVELENLAGSSNPKREALIAQKTKQIKNALEQIKNNIEDVESKSALADILREIKDVGKHDIEPMPLPKPSGPKKKK